MQSFRNYTIGVVGAALFIALGTLLKQSAVAAAVPAKSSAPSRQYYLTKASFTGAEALNQCATGYHFASVAEMNDLSNLTYNATLGRSAEDGAGPPSFDLGVGWLRSGYKANAVVAESELIPGWYTPTNCNLWTSASNADAGVIAFAYPYSSVAGFGFLVGAKNCDGGGLPVGVWCMQD